MFVHEMHGLVSRGYFTEGRHRSPFRLLDELVIIGDLSWRITHDRSRAPRTLYHGQPSSI